MVFCRSVTIGTRIPTKQMCGKFTQLSSWQQVHAFSQPLVIRKPDELIVSKPMRPAFIMRLNASAEREMMPMRWGFSGVNNKTPSKPRHIHARSEIVDTLRTFAQAFHEARGILMVVRSTRVRRSTARPSNGSSHRTTDCPSPSP
jgi:putative SOS response-associated peptidase YedK